MSRRKQANPAKLGESDAGGGIAIMPADSTPDVTPDVDPHSNPVNEGNEFSSAAVKQENLDDAENVEESSRNQNGNDDEEEPEDEDDNEEDDLDAGTDEDDDGSLLNGQDGSPLSSSDQASPASSCQSSLSDAGDANEESAYTLGATPTTPYECDVCKRAFARSSQLSKHLQTHKEQLQFSCPYCRRLFKHKRSRDRHTKLHTGDKKYKCLHCDSAFARSDHLKIHMKTHDNKKPHQCDLCNRGYNTAAALASHQQHHCKQHQQRCGSSNSRSSITGTSPSPGSEKIETQNRKSSETPETPPQTQPPPSLNLPKIACMYCGKDFVSMAHMYAHIHAEHRAIYMTNLGTTPQAQPTPTHLDLPSPSDSTHMGNVEDLSPRTRPSSTPTYACDRCTMRFDSSLLLQEHVESVHWSSLTPRYKYEYDQQTEQKPTDLSRKRRHDDDCTKSEKRVASEGTKPDAVSPYETNDKPCICSYCYAQMPNFKMFLLHMETHVINPSGVLPAVQQKQPTCPLCGETAKNALELGRHIFGHAIANVAAYCCHACKKPFEKPDHLRKHLLEAHAQTIYKCTLCNETFESESTLQMHFSSKHTAECKHFRCNLCSDQIFHDRLTAELHVNMKHSLAAPHHQPGLPGTPSNSPFLGFPLDLEHHERNAPYYQCPFCQKLFKDEYLQYVHILREHNHRLAGSLAPQQELKLSKQDTQRYRCNICQKNNSSESELATHKKLHHTKLRSVSLQCAYCNEHCKSRSDLEHHMKTHQVSSTGKGKHKCNICDEIFTSATTLAEHKLSHCKIVAGNSCTQCKALLGDEQSFYNHQLQHGTSSSGGNSTKNMLALPANCIVCCQTLQTDVEIKLHASFHLRHLRQQSHGLPKEYLCAVCNKLCESTNIHSVPSGYVCTDCTRTTIAPLSFLNGNSIGNGNKSPLKSPIKSPSKTGSPLEKHVFACLKCPRTFPTEEEMQSHASTHILEGTTSSLECHLCRNVLPSPVKLQIHLIEHNFMGIGQYRCYVCSFVFTTATGLRGHIIEHGPDHRPYECSECTTKFYFETELENHKFVHLQQAKNSYEKYVECSKCGTSVPDAYYPDHLHTCNATNSNGNSNSNQTSIVNIKVEKNVDYDLRSEIKTESGTECDTPIV